MLVSEPGVPESGYQALAIVEAVIDLLSEKGIVIPSDRQRIVTLAVEKLLQSPTSVRKSAAKPLSDWLASNKKRKQT
jgi:hypothetical protein